MIVFNCSLAFAEFIEPRKAGPAPLVCEAPSPHPSEDGPHLIDVDGEPARYVQQWLVHFVRIQRQPCAVAMDIETRYAMVFPHLKKGDPEGFINVFATRLMNEMVRSADGVEMIADFEAMLARFVEINERFHLRLLELADNRWRQQMVSDLRKVMKLNRHHSLFKAGRIEESLAEHRAVMQAIRARQPEAAAQRMRDHFASGLEAAT